MPAVILSCKAPDCRAQFAVNTTEAEARASSLPDRCPECRGDVVALPKKWLKALHRATTLWRIA